ncbi:MAG: alpha/beta hydrolase [Gemmatimonadaceae bacterium]
MHPIAYGPAPNQAGDFYPPAADRAPLICLFHGGFWRMPYGRDQLHAMAEDLRAAGLAVWNIGYRRVGEEGSPWPATLLDVEAALTHLPAVQRAHPAIELSRIVLLGHSAGGQLAFWAASRMQRLAQPLRPIAVMGLAPVLDLAAAAAANLGNGAVPQFLGGAATVVPERYGVASPIALLPLRVRQWVLHGEADTDVPPSLSEEYVSRAAAAGDEVTYVPLPDADHMALIDPGAPAYQVVRASVLAAIEPA